MYSPVTTGIPAIFAYPKDTGMLTAASGDAGQHVRRYLRPAHRQQPAQHRHRPQPCPQGADTRIRHRHLRLPSRRFRTR